MVNLSTDNYLHKYKNSNIFSIKTFCGCSLAESSTYVKGFYNVSERLRLNKASYNQTQTFQKRFLVPGLTSISKTKLKGQGQCDTEAVCNASQPKTVSTHQILDSYLT